MTTMTTMTTEWQEMDSAPKNDEKFLVAFEIKGIDGRAVAETHWCDSYYAGFLSDDFVLVAWTPLPAPPTR